MSIWFSCKILFRICIFDNAIIQVFKSIILNLYVVLNISTNHKIKIITLSLVVLNPKPLKYERQISMHCAKNCLSGNLVLLFLIQKKKPKVDKRDLAENNVYFCETCDRGYKAQDKYQEHIDSHVKVSYLQKHQFSYISGIFQLYPINNRYYRNYIQLLCVLKCFQNCKN